MYQQRVFRTRPMTHDIFTHNIAIKRYNNIKQFLATDFYRPTKVSSYGISIQGNNVSLRAYLDWHRNLWIKIIFFAQDLLSQYYV